MNTPFSAPGAEHDLLTVAQAANLLQRTPQTIRKMIANGTLSAIQIEGTKSPYLLRSTVLSALRPVGGDASGEAK